MFEGRLMFFRIQVEEMKSIVVYQRFVGVEHFVLPIVLA